MNARQWINKHVSHLGITGRLNQKEAELKHGFLDQHIMNLMLNPENGHIVVDIETSLYLNGAALTAMFEGKCQTVTFVEVAFPKMCITAEAKPQIYSQPRVAYRAEFQGKLYPTDVRQIKFEFLPVS